MSVLFADFSFSGDFLKLFFTLGFTFYSPNAYGLIKHTRCSEIDHVESWARENNLQLNRTKTREIIFTDKRRK